MEITLIGPNIEDYWYDQKLQSDPSTMNYNVGYDVQYYGYQYDTEGELKNGKNI